MTKDRFRFRVWDTEKKEMLYGAELAYDYMRPCPGGKIIEENCFGDVLENKRYIVEQCTGLKDKNRRLIYEGDIIQHDTVAGPMRWPVLFKNGCFVLPYESGDAWLGKVIDNCPYESGVLVVGNIHENPELLEAKNEN